MSDLDRLISAWLDGSADAAAVARLDAVVRADREAARALAEAARIDADLHGVLRRPVPAVSPSRPQLVARARRRVAWLPSAAAALLVLGLGAWAWRASASTPVVPMAPEIVLAPGGTRPSEAPFSRDGQPLPAGSPLVGTVAIAGGGTVEIAVHSTALAGGDALRPELVLERGRAICTVAPRASGASFTVRTPHGSAAVVGTSFTVAVTDRTRVAVSEGRVAVTGTHGRLEVDAGALAELGADRAPELFAPVAQPLDLPWAAWNNGSADLRPRTDGTGPNGQTALRVDLVDHQTWVGCWWRRGRDWSGHAGLSLTVQGDGSGRRFLLEVLDNAGIPDDGRSCERFIVEVTDERSGWREIRVPFTAMRRRQDLYPDQPNDGFGRTSVHGITLIGEQPLTLHVERIALY